MLATFPCLSRISVPAGRVPANKLDTLKDVIHPEDWKRFVLGELMFKELRFHKNFMLLPKCTSERLTFEDPSLLTDDVNPNMIPANDAACEILNRGLYNANTAALKKRMMECVIAPVPTKGKADSYRFVTLISDKTLIRGCKDDPDDLDS